jgi:hypothetical protein
VSDLSAEEQIKITMRAVARGIDTPEVGTAAIKRIIVAENADLRERLARVEALAVTALIRTGRHTVETARAALVSAPEGDHDGCDCPSVESDDLTTLVCSKCGNRIKPVGGGV